MLRPTLAADDRIVILGAGPTGLGAAFRLKELGFHNFHVFDRSSQVGGLATSYKDEEGFVWDVGGHNTLGVHYDTSPNLRVSGNLVGPGCLHNCIDTKGVSGVISNNITTCSSGRGDQCGAGNAGFYIENTFASSAKVTYRNNVAYKIGIGFQAEAGGSCASKTGGNCSQWRPRSSSRAR